MDGIFSVPVKDIKRESNVKKKNQASSHGNLVRRHG